MTSPASRRSRPTDDVQTYTPPAPERLKWVTGLNDAKCRLNHPMVFTLEKFIIEHLEKRHEMVRVYGYCDTCYKRHGARTYQVGFYSGKEAKWYAVPSESKYREMQEWDGRVTEAMTEFLLVQEWRNRTPNGSV